VEYFVAGDTVTTVEFVVAGDTVTTVEFVVAGDTVTTVEFVVAGDTVEFFFHYEVVSLSCFIIYYSATRFLSMIQFLNHK
jgi:hypothetical protein